jgi:RNA polymerase sigma factor (sigma-70 family)
MKLSKFSEARDSMEGMIVKLVSDWKGTLSHEEAMQCAQLGLWIALKSFDEGKGYKLSTHAYNYIRKELQRYSKSYEEMMDILTYKQSLDSTKEVVHLSNYTYVKYQDTSWSYKEFEEVLRDALPNIDEREFLIYLYGLFGNEKHTQETLANNLGLCRVQVNRKHKAIIQKLRDYMERKGFNYGDFA